MSTADLHDRDWFLAAIGRPGAHDWLSRNLKRIPHGRDGVKVWFTDEHLAAYLKSCEQTPAVGRTDRSKRAAKGRAA